MERKRTVSASDPTKPDAKFYRLYRGALLALGIAWKLVVFMQPIARRGSSLLGTDGLIFLWGLLPYVLLVALARRVGSKVVLVLAAVLVVGTDLIAGRAAMFPQSSTDPVALFFQPFFAVVLIIPLALLAGYGVRTYR